jgi:AAA domain
MDRAKLYFMCGKMAAGKSTHARELAKAKNAVLLVQDEFLDPLYPGEIRTIPDFVKFSARVRDALFPRILDLLSRGISVVLDFPATLEFSVNGFENYLKPPTSSMNCTSSTWLMTAASGNSAREARLYLPALPGPRTLSSMRSRNISRNLLKMRGSMSFVMRGPDPALNRTGRYAAHRELIDGYVRP